jgi:hypothetical protein
MLECISGFGSSGSKLTFPTCNFAMLEGISVLAFSPEDSFAMLFANGSQMVEQESPGRPPFRYRQLFEPVESVQG